MRGGARDGQSERRRTGWLTRLTKAVPRASDDGRSRSLDSPAREMTVDRLLTRNEERGGSFSRKDLGVS